jgi:hypothetical protein
MRVKRHVNMSIVLRFNSLKEVRKAREEIKIIKIKNWSYAKERR